VAAADLACVPVSGPLVVVSNHPFGILDGTILGALMGSLRPDVKIMTNSLLAGIPELHECCFFVDPFGRRSSVRANQRALRRAAFWLRQGGSLVIFPAGEVSHLCMERMQVAAAHGESSAAGVFSGQEQRNIPRPGTTASAVAHGLADARISWPARKSS